MLQLRIELKIAIFLALATFFLGSAQATFAGSLQLPAVEGLDSNQQKLFDAGFKEFKHFFTVREGLGPVYASNACIACHAGGGRGPILLEKMALVLPDTREPVDHPEKFFPWGQSIRPFFAYPANRGTTRETGILNLPDERHAEVLVSQRMPPMIFGRGVMEAVADSEIIRLEAEQAGRADGIHGHINWIRLEEKRLIGRFGLKARLATLESFTADAYVSDMGITNEFRLEGIPNPDGVHDSAAPELPLGKVEEVAFFMRFAASPARVPVDGVGEKIFDKIQCGVCHASNLALNTDHPLARLGLRKADIYSDLLLHKMGQNFADGIIEESAGSQDWRTAPLINLKASKSFLHDGRATSVEAAILAHGDPGSEARAAVESFKKLSTRERRDLVTFVESL